MFSTLKKVVFIHTDVGNVKATEGKMLSSAEMNCKAVMSSVHSGSDYHLSLINVLVTFFYDGNISYVCTILKLYVTPESCEKK